MQEEFQFEPRDNLIKLLREEESFKIQVYSLEAIEIFEDFLNSKKIAFSKEFTSTFKGNQKKIALLVCDGHLKESNCNPSKSKQRIILYSNAVNYQFIPYKFVLSQKEKNELIQLKDSHLTSQEKRDLIKFNPKSSLTSLVSNYIDASTYVAKSLGYEQSVIVMSMIKEKKLRKIHKEVVAIDPQLDNLFLIRLNLNSLVNMNICTRVRDSYTLSVSKETVKAICTTLGFPDIYQ